MIDWWQALLLSVAGALVGGLITLAVSYATHSWTTDAAREAEERQAAHRVKEEERQYTRQHRQERMKPVLDFLEVAKRCAGEEVVIDLMQHAYRRLAETETPALTWEEFEKVMRRDWAVPNVYQLLRAFYGAFLIAPTPEVETALGLTLGAVLVQQQRVSGQDLSEKRAGDAIKSAERLVERYLAEV
jgi:hypothetical protein